MPEHIVERKPRPRDRVVIRLSGGRFFAIPEEAAAGLVTGAELSDEEIGRLDSIDQYLRGRDKAMRMLALRGRSRREIDDALRALQVKDTIRAGIVRELEESGLVDDARFAREFVSVRKEARRMGPHRLRHDMAKLGLARPVVDAALAAFDAGEQEAMARALVEKQLGSAPPTEKTLRRVIAMLRRKGYDYAVVNRVAYDLSRRMRRDFDDADAVVPDDE